MSIKDGEDLVQRFGWQDYLVFGLMLGVSAVIGIYYAIPRKKNTQTSSTDEFLMGGRNMGTFPVAMSLIASFMSAITLLGTPAEIYLYGTMYWIIGLSYLLVMPAAAYLYLPIFYKLQLTSAYEYLEKRFNRVVRVLGSATFSIQMSLYMAVVVYAPALALSQVTGISVIVSVSSIFAVCIFYTALQKNESFDNCDIASASQLAITVSSGLNSLAAIAMEDFVKPFCFPNLSDRAATNVSKALAVLIGLICFGLVFVAAQFGNALEAALSIFGMVGGPLLGVFTLGMFLPWANWIGATAGILSGLVLMFWIGFGSQIAKGQGLLVLRTKPLTTEGCDFLNMTTTEPPSSVFKSLLKGPLGYAPTASQYPDMFEDSFIVSDTLGLYKVSYMWYSTIGCFTVIIVGIIVSFLTGAQDPRKLNPELICPVYKKLYCCFPKKWKEFLRFNVGDEYVLKDDEDEEKMKPFSIPISHVNAAFDNEAESTREKNGYSYDMTKI
ncbi:LOW QUALITY PROTEIN: sodium-dependent multivitamin transporter-like [Artemia franciscana]|uniref:LOW QUALITY PROTEIN: sodium-dependent multivitamin transporter-like n=1 Tax=Artemia franciscana TaxID=6661 RepID=UPI0032DA9E70